MSFATEVKEELLEAVCSPGSEKAMGYGMLLYGRSFSRSEISLLTEHRGTADRYASVFALFGEKIPPVTVTDGGKFRICVTDRDVIKSVLSGLEVINGSMLRRVNAGLLENQENRAAFLRGAFLVCGTVVDPEKEYHLEFAVPTGNLAKDLIAVFGNMGDELSFSPKVTDRNGAHVVYLKKSENIEDTLALMGANEKSLAVMGVKVYKNVRNTVNRRINFESANMARTAQAAAKQCNAIQKLMDAGVFETLSADVREMALLRLDSVELSSAEIGAMLKKPLSVSGVNHRFAKLIKIAEELDN